jgi:hypothetical protein
MTDSLKDRLYKLLKEDFVCDLDGYYYFWPAGGRGHLDANHLRAIADKLDEINKPWDEQIKREIEQYK